MATEVYGASDDLIELEGEISEELSGGEKPALLFFSDGTILTIKYGKEHLAVWEITLIEQGELFGMLDFCTDEDAERYSDTARFKDGLKWVYFFREWRHIKATPEAT